MIKSNLPLKLAIGILVIFGLLFVGMALYLPVWFRIQGWRLESSDPAVREAAAEALAVKGERAMPYLRKWLRSENNRKIIGACLTLEHMEGDKWRRVIEEIKELLTGYPSEISDAAASVVYRTGKLCETIEGNEIKFNMFEKNKAIKRNILIYIIRNRKDIDDDELRRRAARKLGRIGDACAVQPLIHLLLHDSNEWVRYMAAGSLGRIGNARAIEPLIAAYKKYPDSTMLCNVVLALGDIGDSAATEFLLKVLVDESDSDVMRLNAVLALGQIGDKKATGLLLKIVGNDSDSLVRHNAASALGNIGEQVAVDSLIFVLQKDTSFHVRSVAAESLGILGNKKCINPLIITMKTDPDDEVRHQACFSLSWFHTAEIERAMREEAAKGNGSAAIVLALWNGDKDLEYARTLELKDNLKKSFLLAEACWGNKSALGSIIMECEGPYFYSIPFYHRFCSRMPVDLPKYDFKDKYSTRKMQVEAMKAWYEKNKHRLAWDEKARRYFLR